MLKVSLRRLISFCAAKAALTSCTFIERAYKSLRRKYAVPFSLSPSRRAACFIDLQASSTSFVAFDFCSPSFSTATFLASSRETPLVNITTNFSIFSFLITMQSTPSSSFCESRKAFYHYSQCIARVADCWLDWQNLRLLKIDWLWYFSRARLWRDCAML